MQNISMLPKIKTTYTVHFFYMGHKTDFNCLNVVSQQTAIVL